MQRRWFWLPGQCVPGKGTPTSQLYDAPNTPCNGMERTQRQELLSWEILKLLTLQIWTLYSNRSSAMPVTGWLLTLRCYQKLCCCLFSFTSYSERISESQKRCRYGIESSSMPSIQLPCILYNIINILLTYCITSIKMKQLTWVQCYHMNYNFIRNSRFLTNGLCLA